MSDVAIRVENLGKKYVLRHQQEGQSYRTLREALVTKAKSALSFRSNGAAGSHGTREEFWALQDISFEIKQGEAVGIIGRNGAGKSTLLKLLSRITEPTSGRIEIEGRVASLLEVGTGFHPELTGRENIFLNGAILGMSRAEIKRKFDEIVAFAEIEKFLDTPVKRYSSGMYMRLAFAVAAHLESEILVVDEVLAVGDNAFQKKCLGKMDEAARHGRTVLFVSHQMGVVASLCGTGVLLDRGRVASKGEVRRIIEDYLNQAGNSDNRYEADATKLGGGKNAILSVNTEKADETPTSEFAHSESICLSIRLALPALTPRLLLGVGLENTLQSRVFTVVREDLSLLKKASDDVHLVKLTLPGHVIAPNRYSFTIALFEYQGVTYDHVQNACPVRVFDDGTSLSRFEGINYGSVVVDAQWS